MEHYITALFFFLGLLIGVNTAAFVAYFYFKRRKEREMDEFYAYYEQQSIQELVQEAKEKVEAEEAEENKNEEPISVSDDGVISINLSNIHERFEQEQINELSSLPKFKEIAREAIAHHTGNEEYERAGNVKHSLETVDDWFDTRKKWFISKVGSIIKTDTQVCDCPICTENAKGEYPLPNETIALKFFIEELKYRVKGECIHFVEV